MSTKLPPELDAFAVLLDAQSPPVREIFQYCLCLMMVEAGKMTHVRAIPGDEGALTVFQTITGERIALPHPALSQAEETALLATLRQILEEEGLRDD